ncbi:MAG: heavy-metal-associated domain-containing protein [Chloroflexota bacterium]
MESKTFKVPNIGCDGCVKSIQIELVDLDGVSSVTGEVDSKMVTVEYGAPANWDIIVATLEEIDYAPESA